VNGHVFAVDYNSSASRFVKLWNYEVDGHLEWNHPAIGPDGGSYVGGPTDLTAYDVGVIPPNTTPKFYALKPLRTSVNEQTALPANFLLEQNYPNPFFIGTKDGVRYGEKFSTTLRFQVPVASQAPSKSTIFLDKRCGLCSSVILRAGGIK